jgi:hypothetical protein
MGGGSMPTGCEGCVLEGDESRRKSSPTPPELRHPLPLGPATEHVGRWINRPDRLGPSTLDGPLSQESHTTSVDRQPGEQIGIVGVDAEMAGVSRHGMCGGDTRLA